MRLVGRAKDKIKNKNKAKDQRKFNIGKDIQSNCRSLFQLWAGIHSESKMEKQGLQARESRLQNSISTTSQIQENRDGFKPGTKDQTEKQQIVAFQSGHKLNFGQLADMHRTQN